MCNRRNSYLSTVSKAIFVTRHSAKIGGLNFEAEIQVLCI